MQVLGRPEECDIGYLAGLVDGEGCIYASYRKTGSRTFPCLRIFGISKPIIDGAGKIMGVNTCARRDHGEHKGWYVAAQGRKAVDVISLIAPYLTDTSKSCRALTILKVFDATVSIPGRHPSSSIFAHCPPPVKLHAREEMIRSDHVVDVRGAGERPAETSMSFGQQSIQILKPLVLSEMSVLDKGWLCGMVDGEGYVHTRYRSDRDSMYPRLRLFVKSRQIINMVARLMGVNPYARRSHGKLLGWYASVSHKQALRILRLIAPHLLDPSKKCRSQKIIETFGDVGTIHSRLDTFEFFKDCPPPSRIRKSGSIISGS